MTTSHILKFEDSSKNVKFYWEKISFLQIKKDHSIDFEGYKIATKKNKKKILVEIKEAVSMKDKIDEINCGRMWLYQRKRCIQ